MEYKGHIDLNRVASASLQLNDKHHNSLECDYWPKAFPS